MLELVQLIEVAKKLRSIRGYVAWITVLQVCPLIGKEDFSSSTAHIRERIGYLGELFRREVCDKVFSGVNSLESLADDQNKRRVCLTQLT